VTFYVKVFQIDAHVCFLVGAVFSIALLIDYATDIAGDLVGDMLSLSDRLDGTRDPEALRGICAIPDICVGAVIGLARV
jgi:hypothetical protein